MPAFPNRSSENIAVPNKVAVDSPAIGPMKKNADDRRQLLKQSVDNAILAAIKTYCHDSPRRLRDAIEYSWMAPGKRLRPLLALLASEAIGGDAMAALPAAVAVEAIHCYSLIHDDLPAMDDDDLRRGRPTCHIQFDEATAILAGDALQPIAFAVLADGYSDPTIACKSSRLLAEAAGPMGMVAGQADDIFAEQEKSVDKELLSRIHARKTGAMIRVSVELGAIAAGATASELDLMSRFGTAIGLAFQIVDDLLDVQSDVATMGKRTGKDAAAGKLTYPAIYGVDESRMEAARLMQVAIDALGELKETDTGLLELARFVVQRSN